MEVHTDADTDHFAAADRDWQVATGNWNFTDDGGTASTFTIFTVTGDILVTCIGVIDAAVTSVSNLGSISLGIAGGTGVLLGADTVDATAFAVDDVWTIGAGADNGSAIFDHDAGRVIAGGANINLFRITQNLTAGDIDFYAYWRPLSANGNVVAT